MKDNFNKLLPALAATAVLAVPATTGAVMLLSANSTAAPTTAAASHQPRPGDDHGGHGSDDD